MAEKTETSTKPLVPGVAWLKQGASFGLSVTDSPAFKKLRRRELSPSMAFALDGCAAGMAAGRLLPRDEAPFQQNSLGTAAHAVLEVLLALPAEQRTQEEAQAIARRLLSEPELMEKMIGKPLGPMILELSDSDKQLWLMEVDSRTLGLWSIEDPTTVNVHANELAIGGWDFANSRPFPLKATINGVPFVGRIDRTDVILHPETQTIIGYAVRDYKAGKFKPGGGKFSDDYADQIRLYKDAVEQALGLPVTQGNLYFIAAGKDRDIDLSPRAMEGTRARYKRAYDKMNRYADENFWPTKVGPLCGWCPLVNACPAAQAAGKEDQTGTEKDASGRRVRTSEPTAPTPVELGIPVIRKKRDVEDPTRPAQHGASAAHQEAPAAHRSDEAPTTVTEENTPMPATQTAPLLREGTSRDTTVDGSLNPNSYAATAVFGVTQLAVEQLAKAGKPVSGKSVTALSQTLATVVLSAQERLTGSRDWSAGANTRLRGALRTCVETLPLPFDGTAAEWSAWVDSAVNRTNAIAVVSVKLFNTPELPAEPWLGLV